MSVLQFFVTKYANLGGVGIDTAPFLHKSPLDYAIYTLKLLTYPAMFGIIKKILDEMVRLQTLILFISTG